MKILQIIYEAPGSPFGFGGAGFRAHEIYRRLRDRHDITLLCLKYEGARDGKINGLRHIFLGTESPSLSKSVLAYTIRSAAFVRRYGKTFDVIVENFLPSTPFFSRFLTETPVVLQVQGIMEGHSRKKFNPLYSLPMSFVEWFYPKLHSAFIFVSEVTKKKVLSDARAGGIFSPVIPNGINSELLRTLPGDENYILFFSRIDRYTKGLDLLIQAFTKIHGSSEQVKLILAGYEFDRFEDLVSGLPPAVKERIGYAGFVSGEEKVRLLSGARFAVLPSRHESSPISVLEAAACGKAVIVSDIAELRFVEENGFGMCFRSGSVDDLAEKMQGLLHEESSRERMGLKGREYAGEFLWDAIALRFEEALREVVTSFRRVSRRP
jgi:glycosyltransferase involved in cell wall biosynthesis